MLSVQEHTVGIVIDGRGRRENHMNTRREFLIALGAGLLTAPLVAFAQQQGKVWRVGFLGTRRPVSLDADAYGAFPRGNLRRREVCDSGHIAPLPPGC